MGIDKTTEEVKKLLDQGYKKGKIAKMLGVRPATITHHAKKLGADYQKRDQFLPWKDIQTFYDEGHTIRECSDKFCFSIGSWGKAKIRGQIKTKNTTTLLSQLLICPSYFSRTSLKKDYLNEKRSKFYLTKEQLHDMVWSIPTTEIAKKFGVSDKAIDKRCRKLGVEKPPRGYWTKILHSVEINETTYKNL